MSFRYNLWNSPCVFHDRLLEGGLTVYSDAYYYRLTHVADKYRYHYDKTALVRTQQIKRKISTLNFDVSFSAELPA